MAVNDSRTYSLIRSVLASLADADPASTRAELEVLADCWEEQGDARATAVRTVLGHADEVELHAKRGRVVLRAEWRSMDGIDAWTWHNDANVLVHSLFIGYEVLDGVERGIWKVRADVLLADTIEAPTPEWKLIDGSEPDRVPPGIVTAIHRTEVQALRRESPTRGSRRKHCRTCGGGGSLGGQKPCLECSGFSL